MSRPQPVMTRMLAMIVGVLVLLASGTALAGVGPAARLNRCLGERDAVLVTDCRSERVLYARNETVPLVPASIVKVVTSLAALAGLGEDYRFETDFFVTPAGDLVIKGYGDPCFVSAEIEKAAAVVARHVQKVGDIIVDDSYFAPIHIPGRAVPSLQPYDAPNGALCANFNTVAFVRDNGHYRSAEPETPLLPFAEKRLRRMPVSRGRVLLINHQDKAAEYAGRLFAWFFTAAGAEVQGEVRPGRADTQADRLVYRHRSGFRLEDIVTRLMRYSNNFTANQLMLACGARRKGAPATLAAGRAALRHYLEETLGIQNVRLADGAGLSRENRITVEAMDKALAAFRPYRPLMRRDGDDLYKTGNLNGVSTRVGFVDGPDGRLHRYVIMLNTPGKRTDLILPIVRELILSG
ncbi:MAG: D-alanyl-D-alanine carboxypeptidase/D-alanyl-D-alanine-endopeptidase [Desulfosudaceae bacterium]